MTGEKNRYKTLDKMWKIDDEQLKTPKHDEMVLYLLNKDNINSLIERKPQQVVREHNSYFMSFISQKGLRRRLHEKDKIFEIISESHIKAENGFLIGYWDIEIIIAERNYEKDKFYGDYLVETYYIEIKPKITSFGTTLRQLRTYQNYLKDWEKDNIFLFTEDLRFKDAFESQGIKVISPPEHQSTLFGG